MNNEKNFIKETPNSKMIVKRKVKKFIFCVLVFVLFVLSLVLSILFLKKYNKKIDLKIKTNVEREVEERIFAYLNKEAENKKDNKKENIEQVENIVNLAIEGYKFDLNSLKLMYASFLELTNELDNSIVEIRKELDELDFLENDNKEILAGLILYKNEDEVIVLSPLKDFGNKVNIILKNNKEYSASLKNYDENLGISFYAFNITELDEESKNELKEVTFSSSSKLKLGENIIILGAPLNKVHSVEHSIINYLDKEVSFIDRNVTNIQTSLVLKKDIGNYIFNMDGEFIAFSRGSENDRMLATSSFDLKDVLDKMSSLKDISYLGIEAKDIYDNLKDYGIDRGIYITRVVEDSPMYDKRVQVGDILTHINGNRIKNMIEYKNVLNLLKDGDEIKLGIKRYAVNDYVDLEFDIVVSKR